MKASFKRVKDLKNFLNAVIIRNHINRDEVVIIHSPFKTGTTTIGGALVLMGYADQDHGYHRDLNLQYKQKMDIANELASGYTNFNQFKREQNTKIQGLLKNLFLQAKGYKVFGDIPFGHIRIHPFVKKLFMPNAKFIWINREEESWFNSARKWQLAHPDIYIDAEKKWQENAEKEKKKLRKLRDEGYEEFLKLQENFPNDCLVISLEAADWQPLSRFLDIPAPEIEFPVLNKARQ